MAARNRDADSPLQVRGHGGALSARGRIPLSLWRHDVIPPGKDKQMIRFMRAAIFAICASAALAAEPASSQPAAPQNQGTDWGGGYFTGVDSATQMAARSATGEKTTVQDATTPEAKRCASLAGYATLYAQENPNKERFARIPDAPTAIFKAEIDPPDGIIPEVCKIDGVIAPNIGIEMRLPTKAWNGKFMEYGCGGACGLIYNPQLREPLSRGYATIASDMGHSGQTNLYTYASMSAIIDFTYRATHVVALVGKEATDMFYGKPPKKSYYMGCSTGGVQGVIEAQRFPNDFNAILVSAPAYSSGPSYLAWGAHANLDKNGNGIMDPDKLPMVRKAVLDACDALDGLKDGLLMDPTQCKWDPGAIECKAGVNTKQCLTHDEVEVVRKIYAGPMNSKGELLSYGPAGMQRGSEYGWSPSFIAPKGQKATRLEDVASSFGRGFYPTVAANAFHEYDYDTDPQRGDILSWLRYGMNPDLRRFRDAGGKMILYHGWDDNEVAPGSSVDYYQTTSMTMGGYEATQKFFRLFMLPGVGHCRRGPGGDAGDFLTALENWDDKGQAPDEMIMFHLKKEQNYLGLPRPIYPLEAGSYDRTRPVYPYPDVAKYSGKGDPTVASSWEKAPRETEK
jgi:feruloyl esterase